VLPIVHRKAYAMLAMLLVCMTVTLVMECQVHTAVSAHGHATPAGHHPSGYTAGAVPCLLAVLPLGVSLIVFVYFRFYTTLLVWHYAAPAFPLFRPPRNVAATQRPCCV
jgi:hypothetical protein